MARKILLFCGCVVAVLLAAWLSGCSKPQVPPEENPEEEKRNEVLPEQMMPGTWWVCEMLGKHPIVTPEQRVEASGKIMGYINLILLEPKGSKVYTQVQQMVGACMDELRQLGFSMSLQDSMLEVHAPEGVKVEGKGRCCKVLDGKGRTGDNVEVVFPKMVLQSQASVPVYRRKFVEYYSGRKDTLQSQQGRMLLRVPGTFVCGPVADTVTAMGLKVKGATLRKFGETFPGFNAVLIYRGADVPW